MRRLALLATPGLMMAMFAVATPVAASATAASATISTGQVSPQGCYVTVGGMLCCDGVCRA